MCPHNLEGLLFCFRVIVRKKSSNRAGVPAGGRIKQPPISSGSTNTTCVRTSCGTATSRRPPVLFPYSATSVSNGRNDGGSSGRAQACASRGTQAWNVSRIKCNGKTSRHLAERLLKAGVPAYDCFQVGHLDIQPG